MLKDLLKCHLNASSENSMFAIGKEDTGKIPVFLTISVLFFLSSFFTYFKHTKGAYPLFLACLKILNRPR